MKLQEEADKLLAKSNNCKWALLSKNSNRSFLKVTLKNDNAPGGKKAAGGAAGKGKGPKGKNSKSQGRDGEKKEERMPHESKSILRFRN